MVDTNDIDHLTKPPFRLGVGNELHRCHPDILPPPPQREGCITCFKDIQMYHLVLNYAFRSNAK